MDTSQLLSDSIVANYRKQEQVGSGGSSTVFRCHHVDDPKTAMALKVLHRRVVDNVSLRRFQRECDTLNKLSGSPGVVTLLDHGILQDGTAWLVTELYDISYAERLLTLGSIPVEEVIDVGYEIANALCFAHAHNIVHGDVKPANFLRTNSGHIALGDFGTSLDLDRTLTLHSGMSIAYVSPETLRDGVVTQPSDLYSLGVSLFHLLCGKSPLPENLNFSNALPLGPLLAYFETGAKPSLDAEIFPRNLCEIIEQMMSKDASQRPANAKLVARQFKAMQLCRSHITLGKRFAAASVNNTDDNPCVNPLHTVTPAKHAHLPDSPQLPDRSVNQRLLSSVCVLKRGSKQHRLHRLILPVSTVMLALAGFWYNQSQTSQLSAFTSEPVAVATVASATKSMVCPPGVYLCEDFESGMAQWQSNERSGIATLTMSDRGWYGRALEFTPSKSHVDGESYLYQRVAKPVPGEAVRITFRLLADKSESDYYWMNLLQFVASTGEIWSLNMQHLQPDRMGFDAFYYDTEISDGDEVATNILFEYRRWHCIEMIINPDSDSALQIYIDSRFIGQLSNSPKPMMADSYEIKVGSTDVQPPATAPRLLFDNIIIDRGSKPECQ